MKNLVVRHLFTALCLVVTTKTNASIIDDSKINKLFVNLATALNDKKANEVGALWAENAEFLTLAGGVIKGREKIISSFEEAFNGAYKTAKYQYFVQNIRYRGDSLAIVDGIWKITNGPLNYPSCGIFLELLSRKQSVWLIDVSMHSVPRHGHTTEYGRSLSWTKICDQ